MEGAAAPPWLADLTSWLDDRLPGAGQPLTVRAATEGASNHILFLTRGPYRWVLRRPPDDHHDPATADRIVLREARVCRALDGSGVPVPTIVAVNDDPGVTGRCFLVMEQIDGFAPGEDLPEPFASSPDLRLDLAHAFIDALADLHGVDWHAVGLQGFGRPEGFLERQVSRWRSHLEAVRQRDLPDIDAIGRWLDDHRPTMQRAAVMHGDYHFANVMVAPHQPVRLAAIIDWEQSTVGDPLLDLGWVTSAWPDPSQRLEVGYVRDRTGMPAREALVARYAHRTGLDVTPLPFYEVLARYKLACVLEGSYQRWVDGTSTDPQHERMGDYVLSLLADATAQITAL